MRCIGTSKDQETCNVEKMGCEGCAYYIPDETKTLEWAIQKIEALTKERDYYKARYLEFNNFFIQNKEI